MGKKAKRREIKKEHDYDGLGGDAKRAVLGQLKDNLPLAWEAAKLEGREVYDDHSYSKRIKFLNRVKQALEMERMIVEIAGHFK